MLFSRLVNTSFHFRRNAWQSTHAYSSKHVVIRNRNFIDFFSLTLFMNSPVISLFQSLWWMGYSWVTKELIDYTEKNVLFSPIVVVWLSWMNPQRSFSGMSLFLDFGWPHFGRDIKSWAIYERLNLVSWTMHVPVCLLMDYNWERMNDGGYWKYLSVFSFNHFHASVS